MANSRRVMCAVSVEERRTAAHAVEAARQQSLVGGNALGCSQPRLTRRARRFCVCFCLADRRRRRHLRLTPARHGCDGFFAAVDPDDSNVAYSEYTNADLRVTTDGGTNWRGIAPTLEGTVKKPC